MKFTETELKGVYKIEPVVLSDERGEFFRTYDDKLFSGKGFPGKFVQHNHSISFHKGTWRGMHYQNPPMTETKLIRCVSGSVLDYILDLRTGSQTFLKWTSIEISAANNLQLLIPDGCAHGFYSLEDRSALLYYHSQYYDAAAEAGIRYDDPRIGLKLPAAIERISKRDLSFPFLPDDFKGLQL